MGRWDFLDSLPPLDLSKLTVEQVPLLFDHFDENDRAQILADLRGQTDNAERQKRAVDLLVKIGEFVLEKGISLSTGGAAS